MSAPDTNVERQEMQHKPSLLGIRGAMLFGAAMFVGVFLYASMQGSEPGATGEIMGSDVAVDPVAVGTNVTN